MLTKRMMQVTVVLGMLILGFGAQATTVDATLNLTNTNDSGFLGVDYGGFFQQIDALAGTGVFPSFVRINDHGITEAYNTTADNVLDNTVDNPHNHELLLSNVAIVDIGGIDYRMFTLDIGQGGPNPKLESLDEIQIFQSGTANQSVTTFGGSGPGILDLAGTLVYRLDDANFNNSITLNATLNPGGGWGDMNAYIPDSLFDPSFGQYVYLYSRFGEIYPATGTFEEWAARPPIPEPASIILLGLGLGGLVFKKTRRAV